MKPARLVCVFLFLAATLSAQSTAVALMKQHGKVVRPNNTTAQLSKGRFHVSASQVVPTEKVLYSFTGGADAGYPIGSLISDLSGNLYGTTSGGGSAPPCAASASGCGNVFELSPTASGGWTETVPYSFTGGSDGWNPLSGLIFDSKGNLFGTTAWGGSSTCTYTLGCGTVFELTTSGNGNWTMTTIYSFVGGSDGQNPMAQLVFDSGGNLYGTTVYGGVPSCFADVGCGTVFELTSNGTGWTESILYAFNGDDDGRLPRSSLTLDGGKLYGTTERGGGSGWGAVYELTPTTGGGWTETVLYSFTDGNDGAYPEAGLILNAGNLVGTTSEGGDLSCNLVGGSPGCGTVYEMYPSQGTWQLRVLYSFTGGMDGGGPLAGVFPYQSNLYGTTYDDGGSGCSNSQGCGTVYELSPTTGGGWTESVLFRFDGSDGGGPEGLTFDASGNLYGTTYYEGLNSDGNVFELSTVSTTTTALSSSPNPSIYGQPVTFTATVTSPSADVPTGSVSYFDSATGTNLGSSSLNGSGVAVSQYSTLGPSTHTITATFSGDANFTSSVSPALSQVVLGAAAKFSTSLLNFEYQTVGITSAAQTVTLTNTGDIPLSFTSITMGGLDPRDFSQTNNCGSSLAGQASCTISVTFTPTKSGSRSAAVVFMDNAPSKLQRILLTGLGALPLASPSPMSLTFPRQVIYTTSLVKTVTLDNFGLGILKISTIGVSAPFHQTNNCGSAVAPGSNCEITVTFRPTSIGTFTGALSISDNAPTTPQKVALSGTGTAVAVTPVAIGFGNQPVGTTSLARTITLSNESHATVNIVSILIAGGYSEDFTQTNTCGTSLAPGASCFIKVKFTPSEKGKRTSEVSITDDGGGSPQKVSLAGTGTP